MIGRNSPLFRSTHSITSRTNSSNVSRSETGISNTSSSCTWSIIEPFSHLSRIIASICIIAILIISAAVHWTGIFIASHCFISIIHSWNISAPTKVGFDITIFSSIFQKSIVVLTNSWIFFIESIDIFLCFPGITFESFCKSESRYTIYHTKVHTLRNSPHTR